MLIDRKDIRHVNKLERNHKRKLKVIGQKQQPCTSSTSSSDFVKSSKLIKRNTTVIYQESESDENRGGESKLNKDEDN